MLHKIWNIIYVKYLNYYIFAGFFRAQSEMARKNRTLMTGRSAHSIERRAQSADRSEAEIPTDQRERRERRARKAEGFQFQ
jgi:hypothetical protein